MQVDSAHTSVVECNWKDILQVWCCRVVPTPHVLDRYGIGNMVLDPTGNPPTGWVFVLP